MTEEKKGPEPASHNLLTHNDGTFPYLNFRICLLRLPWQLFWLTFRNEKGGGSRLMSWESKLFVAFFSSIRNIRIFKSQTKKIISRRHHQNPQRDFYFNRKHTKACRTSKLREAHKEITKDTGLALSRSVESYSLTASDAKVRSNLVDTALTDLSDIET